MINNVKELKTIDELTQALKESAKKPVLLFKHSLTCPVSAHALSEFQFYLKQADSRVSYKLIMIQNARDVSNEAAARLKIEHQSPQVILVRDGRQVWNASHYAITSAALAQAIQSICF